MFIWAGTSEGKGVNAALPTWQMRSILILTWQFYSCTIIRGHAITSFWVWISGDAQPV
jgi:hypothetical protein